ncbi:MAG: hypothetical protein ACPG5T_04555 [Endozoicomonas sp.]
MRAESSQIFNSLLAGGACVFLLVGGDRHYEYYAGLSDRENP